jgi:hypothetical protein
MAKSTAKRRPFADPRVAEIFREYPKEVQNRLLFLRELIFDTASAIEGVGELEETLRWGEPTYLTTASGTGTMVRINSRGSAGRTAVFFHCQTGLIPMFKTLYADTFAYEGKRAIIFEEADSIPVEKLSHCISLALTYHRDRLRPKRRGRRNAAPM